MSNPATQSRTESITVLRSEAAKTGTASRIASTKATPPAATTDRARRARLRNFMPNRSPTRCPKLVGHFHLPSTFRAPSEFRSVGQFLRTCTPCALGYRLDGVPAAFATAAPHWNVTELVSTLLCKG